MLFFDSISEILDDIIQSKMDISACRSLLDSLFPYRYHSVDSGCYDLRKEIIINSDGNYHITAYDLPYIDACQKLIKFYSNDSDAYPILFAMLDSVESKLDYYACSLIKIFSCAYKNPALVIFVSDERVAFGTVRSEAQIEDNFCLSDWFLPFDFDTKITFAEDAYTLSEVACWIKKNSLLEKTKRGCQKKKNKINKLASWNYDYNDFNLDYIYALYEIQGITGISTLRQRDEYYMTYNYENKDNQSDMIDEAEDDSMEYVFDDIASEISYVGNTTRFDELDDYSDNLEISEINAANVAEPDYSGSPDLLDYDEDIPEDVWNDPEKLLKYLETNKSDYTSHHEVKTAKKEKNVELHQTALDSLKGTEPVELPTIKPLSYDIDASQSTGIAMPGEKPHIEVNKVESIERSQIEKTSVEDIQKFDSAIDVFSSENPLADVIKDLETLVDDLFESSSLCNDVPVEETAENNMLEKSLLSDVLLDLETAVNDLFDDVQKAESTESLDNDNIDEETTTDEKQESEITTSDIPDEEQFASEAQALKLPSVNVSEEEPVCYEIPKNETAESGVTKQKTTSDIQGMISHFELISMVNVHSETVFRYIREKKIIPDRVIKNGARSVYYFTPKNVKELISKCDWHIISESNKRRIFLQMIDKMTMSFSYKPVFIKAFFATAKNGKSSMSKIVAYFHDFYEARRKSGLFVEKPNSIFSRPGYTDKDVKKLILVYPYKRFAEMQIFTYSKLLGTVSMDPNVWNSLHSSEIAEICQMCNEHIDTYYSRVTHGELAVKQPI